MRKYAVVPGQHEIQKVMIYETDQEVYLFTYDTGEDLPCISDYWFETLEEAEQYSADLLGNLVLKWIHIADPEQGEQHDLIISGK